MSATPDRPVGPDTPTVKAVPSPAAAKAAEKAGSGTLRMADRIYHLEEDFSARAEKAFEACCRHLHTGIFDWVVSDGDTEACMQELKPLSFAEVIAVIHKLGETRDGSTNLLTKLYDRGLESREQIAAWRKLMHDKLLSATNRDGQIPDLNVKLAEYQLKYVPANVLQRGF
jgi:hypothetical protein